MTDRHISFSGPMIWALLDGSKTQTRRVLKPQIVCHTGDVPSFSWGKFSGLYPDDWFGYGNEIDGALPYRPGDRLWVKESWFPIRYPGHPTLHSVTDYTYRATDAWDYDGPMPWKSPRFMPKVASRLTLIVTDVRVQRLQEISEADAIAEGVFVPEAQYAQQGSRATVLAYAGLWEDLNAARGYGWDTNPWVVALTFRVIKANIDSLQEAA